jgi:uncharacterized secreted protein with C-terminal beta-propeller domain
MNVTHEVLSPLNDNRLISLETMKGKRDIYMDEILDLMSQKEVDRMHFEFDESEGNNLYGMAIVFQDKTGIKFIGYHGGEFLTTEFSLQQQEKQSNDT